MNKTINFFFRLQAGCDGSRGGKDFLRMDSDDSDSDLDIEGSTTPDTNSMHGSFEGEQPSQPHQQQQQHRKSSNDNNNKSVESESVADFVARKPMSDSLHSFLGHIHQQQLQQHADNFLAKNWLKSESGGGATNNGGMAGPAGGLAALGGLGGLGGAGLAGGLGGPFSIFPFNAAAAAAAQLPFPNFLSQASLFHVKDSV
jgi:hypothetical protein